MPPSKHLRPGRPPRGLKQAALWYGYAVMGYTWADITRRWAYNIHDVAYVVMMAERWATLYEQPWPPTSPVANAKPEEVRAAVAEAMAEDEAEDEDGPEVAEYEKDMDPLGFLIKD